MGKKEEIMNDVDVSPLEIGMVVKNYKEMCSILGEEPKSGCSKKSQMKNWERYFEITKVKGSQKMMVSDIYDEPLTVVDGRSRGNNSIYVKSIEVVLLYYLSQQKGYTATFTKARMWKMLGMVNQHYKTLPNSELKKIDYVITDYEINHFYQRCDNKLTNILFSAMNNLKHRFIIEFEEQVVCVDANNRYILADDRMKKNIMAVKYKVRTEMGFESEQQIYLKMKAAEFYKAVNYYLNKLYGYKYTFKQYKVIFNQNIVMEEIPRIEQEFQRALLNENIIGSLNRSAKKHYDSVNTSDKEFRLSNSYIQAQELLTNKLIKLKSNADTIESYEPYIDEELDRLFAQ